ncbi:hypothetical protein [Aliihoeflea sp. PC F10.4]
MSVWEFSCAVEGFNKSRQTGEAPAPSMDDARLADLGIEGF